MFCFTEYTYAREAKMGLLVGVGNYTEGKRKSSTRSRTTINEWRWWFVGLILVDLGLLAATLLNSLPEPMKVHWIWPINLNGEMNFAAWFSGMQLLIAGTACATLATRNWPDQRRQSEALIAIACVLVILFADEVGSLHERASLFLGVAGSHLSLVPFAIIVVGLAGYGFFSLIHRRDLFGRAWICFAAAFALFASVYLQELIEHAREWSRIAWALRAVIEEGTELTGFGLLLWGCAVLDRRQRFLYPGPDRDDQAFPLPMPSQSVLRLGIAVCLAAAIPLIILRLIYSTEVLALGRRGDFGYLAAVAVYALSAMYCFRCGWLDRSNRTRWWVGMTVFAAFSANATVLFHRFVLGSLMPKLNNHPWRAEFDLLWVIPVAGIVLLNLPVRPIKRWRFFFLAVAWLAALLLVRTDGYPLATYILVNAVAFAVVQDLITRQQDFKKSREVNQ